MGKFEFRDYSRTLEFPGCEFTIICNSDTGDKIRSFSPEMQALKRDYDNGAATKDQLIDYVVSRIDAILGVGATEQIFAGRDITMSDATDVMLFIISEVNDANKRTTVEVLNQIQESAVDAPEK